MEFTDVVLKRRMVRHFKPDPVPLEIIERMVALARHAPSAGFTQGQSFIVVTRPQTKRELARICGEEHYVQGGFHSFISEAPVLIVPCTSEAAYHRRYQEKDKVNDEGTEIEWPVPYWYMDIGCSVMLLLLAAVNEGMVAGFAGAFDLDEVRQLLGIPDEVTPVGVIPVGYRDQDVPSPSLKRGRKSEAEYLHHEQW
ncbi:MAG: nitroreductase family protein [Chloroflexi bacterium]|nr:nitroreductase family protein [Chloroflexota bacterium]